MTATVSQVIQPNRLDKHSEKLGGRHANFNPGSSVFTTAVYSLSELPRPVKKLKESFS